MSYRWVALGEAVRAAREDRGLSREQLAEIVGISDHYPGYVERGQRRPTPPMLARFAEALDTDYTELARLGGYAVRSIGEHVVQVDDPRAAAVLRQLAAEFDAAELQRLLAFGREWLPERRRAARRSA